MDLGSTAADRVAKAQADIKAFTVSADEDRVALVSVKEEIAMLRGLVLSLQESQSTGLSGATSAIVDVLRAQAVHEELMEQRLEKAQRRCIRTPAALMQCRSSLTHASDSDCSQPASCLPTRPSPRFCSKMLQLLANDKLREKIDALRREKSATLSLQAQLRRDGAKQAAAMAAQSGKVASLIGRLNETTAQVRDRAIHASQDHGQRPPPSSLPYEEFLFCFRLG